MIFPYKTTKMTSELLENLEKLHTTELGVVRIKRNLGLKTDDVIGWCKNTILSAAKNIENEKALLKSALDYEQIQMFNEKKENL